MTQVNDNNVTSIQLAGWLRKRLYKAKYDLEQRVQCRSKEIVLKYVEARAYPHGATARFIVAGIAEVSVGLGFPPAHFLKGNK